LFEQSVGRGVIMGHDLARQAQVLVAELGVEAVLPICVTELLGVRRRYQLARDKNIVGDCVRCKVAQVTQRECL
jgi:hypothetical protein